MKTLEFIAEHYKSECLDNRDIGRLAQFIPFNMVEKFGIKPKDEWNNEGKWNSTVEPFTRENGQGLLLCDTGKDTFDTTPSNTGIRYAAELISELDGVDEVTAHYVTRPYLTRHGDGAFIGESRRGLISQYIPEDRTNHYNDCQGEFRYGFLDIADLYDRILVDVSKTSRVFPLKNFETVLEVTHCDEMDRVNEFEKYFPKVKTHNSPFV